MSAALKPTVARRTPPKRLDVRARQLSTPSAIAPVKPNRRSQVAPSSRVARLPSAPGQGSVRNLPTARPLPMWIRLLMTVQQGSTITVMTLVGVALAIYGWTAYTQHLWGREYQRLEQLQRTERQLTEANEVFKENIAQQAENPAYGLVPASLGNAVFLNPAPARPANPLPETPPAKPIPTTPLGY